MLTTIHDSVTLLSSLINKLVFRHFISCGGIIFQNSLICIAKHGGIFTAERQYIRSRCNRYQKVSLQNLIRHKSKLFVLTAEIRVFVRKI